MTPSENTLTYTSTNSYTTLNRLSESTKNVWIVLHGLGYLSRYFIRHFDGLPADENYIIAPQAPSKYYLNTSFTRVGASWLTKEDTQRETENLMAYLDGVLDAEKLPENCNLIVLGFSQGVSIASRWVAQRKIECNQLVLYAGGIPDELQSSDFDFLFKKDAKVTVIVGVNDEYVTEERRKTESEKILQLFDGKAEEILFKGGHEVKGDLIRNLIR
ncbi:Predicted esterase [Pricia antarctica]|uniref:Predicted esterase n=1 Tax=Pricia antarctica TaxID=641691 RepID=A0A1G7FF33_9FLAO|nr:esterase [Pricia antarctica]SDE74500.1 Predicted esterase [Pricia antarctica]